MPEKEIPLRVRLRLCVAYEGAPFRGWQSQACGGAVQDHLEAALLKIVGERTVVHGAGRTDAGVHALGQVAHIDIPASLLPLKDWRAALNGNLPDEIRVITTSRVRPDFHARFDACGKIYHYRIYNAPFLHPLEIGHAWFMPRKIDFALLQQACALLEGEHDFAAFASNRGQVETDTVRMIHAVRLQKRGQILILRFHGTGFLYHMVRLLTGSLIRCSTGGAPLKWLHDLLEHPQKEKTRYLAPAHGLFLERVLY